MCVCVCASVRAVFSSMFRSLLVPIEELHGMCTNSPGTSGKGKTKRKRFWKENLGKGKLGGNDQVTSISWFTGIATP